MSSSSYRAAPDEAAAVLAAVEAQPVSRDGLSTAFSRVLEAIRNTDDEQVDAVIIAVSALDGDLRDAPARIDARIAEVLQATRSVLAAIEDGDAQMAAETAATRTGAFEARRFGPR